MKVGRNDPCPCGSGRKYKRCCLEADRVARAEQPEQPDPPDPSGYHRALRKQLARLSTASREEFERFRAEDQSTRATTPVDDFEGLSPEQLYRLLDGTIDSIPDIVTVREPLPDEVALEADVVRGVRWILGYLADHAAEVKLTARGNFPRVMCLRYLDECTTWWKRGESVPSAGSIGELVSAHQLALNAGYVAEDGSRVWITTAGAQIYASGRWGSVFPKLVRFTLDQIDWRGWLDRGWQHEHFSLVQRAAPFVLRLLHLHPSGREAEIFDRFATAFPHFTSPANDDPKSMDILRNVFGRLTLEEFCEPFGLVRVENQPSRGDGPGERRYETTRLFRELFEWRTL